MFSDFCIKNAISVVTAESCTAGLMAATIAQTPGSSAWLDSGYVVYTAEAKIRMLGVSPDTIERFDITSEQVACEMALGALERSTATLAMAVTGLAGPGGGTASIPVGTVCMAWAFRDRDVVTLTRVFEGDRNSIRQQVVDLMLSQAPSYYLASI